MSNYGVQYENIIRETGEHIPRGIYVPGIPQDEAERIANRKNKKTNNTVIFKVVRLGGYQNAYRL